MSGPSKLQKIATSAAVATPAPVARQLRGLSDRAIAWLFVTPTILLLLAINIFPLIWTIQLSFTNYKANRAARGEKFIGLRNYERVLGDADIWITLQTTAHFLIWTMLLQVLLGFGLAWLLNKQFKGHSFWTTLILLPMMLSPAVVGNFWRFLYQPQIGLFNYIIAFFTGADPSSFEMLGDVNLAPWSIVIVDTWMWTPYIMLICLAGLRSIPDYISLAVEKNSIIAYLTICLAMFLENIIPPIPSEIIMPLGGFFVYQQKLNFYILVFWGLIGTILGSLPWYYLGRLVNEKRLSNFLDKKGKYLGISSNDLSKSKRWFDKYGVSLVFWGRLVPGIRTLISVPAGIELMPLRKFLIWTTFGSLIWVALLTYSGYLFGENYPIFQTYLDQIKYFVKPILILIFLYFFIRILIRFFKKNKA